MTDVLDRLRAIFDDPEPRGLDDKTREVIVDAIAEIERLEQSQRQRQFEQRRSQRQRQFEQRQSQSD